MRATDTRSRRFRVWRAHGRYRRPRTHAGLVRAASRLFHLLISALLESRLQVVGAFDGSEGTFWTFRQKEGLGVRRNPWLPLSARHAPRPQSAAACLLLTPTWPHKAYCYFSQFRVEGTEARVSRGGGAGPERRRPDSGTAPPAPPLPSLVTALGGGCPLGWGGRHGLERPRPRLPGALLSSARVLQGLHAAAGRGRPLRTRAGTCRLLSQTIPGKRERADQSLIVVSLAVKIQQFHTQR